MATMKATFTLDEETALNLRRTAERLNRSKSAIVREAILDYSERVERLSSSEQRRLLSAFDELVPKIPERPVAEVEAELDEIRQARRRGGRGSSSGGRS